MDRDVVCEEPDTFRSEQNVQDKDLVLYHTQHDRLDSPLHGGLPLQAGGKLLGVDLDGARCIVVLSLATIKPRNELFKEHPNGCSIIVHTDCHFTLHGTFNVDCTDRDVGNEGIE